VKQEARQLIEAKPWLGPERLAWELQNVGQMQISPATIKRMKHAMQQAQTPPPPAPTWRFYARHHPHSLWHGDCLEKVFDQATGRQLYQVTLLDDYSRGYVFCDLFDFIDPRTTIAALCAAMRQWQVIPKGVVFDQSGVFRGKLLEPSVATWASGSSMPRPSTRKPMVSWNARFETICRSFIATSPSGNSRRCGVRCRPTSSIGTRCAAIARYRGARP
jgi:hypothetical protein